MMPFLAKIMAPKETKTKEQQLAEYHDLLAQESQILKKMIEASVLRSFAAIEKNGTSLRNAVELSDDEKIEFITKTICSLTSYAAAGLATGLSNVLPQDSFEDFTLEIFKQTIKNNRQFEPDEEKDAPDAYHED